MVVHCRMEDKFIHGVTTTHVFAHHPCEGIIIIDDALVGDRGFRNLLMLAVPERVKLYFFGLDKALAQIERAEQSERNYYIILRGPQTARELYDRGYRFPLPLTCGQLPMREDTLNVMNGVGLSDDEIEILDFLDSHHVEIVFDPNGIDENIPWEKAKKSLESARKKREKVNISNKNTSLSKTLNILDCFMSDGPISLSLSEIQLKTKIPVSTCYRLVDFLEQNGYLSKSQSNKKYSLGWKLLLLATSYSDTRKDILFQELAPPYLRVLQEEFNETACIYVRVGPKMKCVVVSPSLHLLQVRPRLNRLFDFEKDATGFVLAMGLPQSEWRDLFGKHTEEDIGSILKRVQLDGVCMSSAAGEQGITSISAPVVGVDGEVYGALTLQGPTARFCDDRLDAKMQQVKEAAQQLTDEMQQTIVME